jgi:hypothetical protein
MLRGNSVYYEIAKRRAYSGIGLRPELTDRPDLLATLDRDGIVVIPGYSPADQIASMRAAVDGLLGEISSGKHKEHVFTLQPTIMYRVAKADQLVPETRAFFDERMIRNIFSAYLSPAAASYRHEIDYRFGQGEFGQADLFHFDNWRPICKAFLYLTDVGPDQAPFAYLKGTHKLGRWRKPYDLEFDIGRENGRYGHFFPQEMRRLRREHAWEEIVCTGAAGTLILADFRGLHRGTPLRGGRRLLLNNTFDLMNPEIAT